jgi:hypothetical protein
MKLTHDTTLEDLNKLPRNWSVYEERGFQKALSMMNNLLLVHMAYVYDQVLDAEDCSKKAKSKIEYEECDIMKGLFNQSFTQLSRLCGPTLTKEVVEMKAKKRFVEDIDIEDDNNEKPSGISKAH